MKYTKPQITNTEAASTAIMGNKVPGSLDNPIAQLSTSSAYSADE
jgi:hypothetical protein